eukprot:TRINITY_DN10053_c0_g1_i3.p1 TRINITY_DN10053_c0_g1~~TRINITY_DN10053_c0_g1_i3.p1  ORF type:complete len:234 (-),score=-13.75 TRINITY_DN10053_c0_g1_i3:453-1154(-)
MSNKRQKNTFNETNYYSNLFYLLTKSTRSKLKQYLNCANQINNILALFPLIIIFKTFGIFQCNLFHPCQVTKLISINMERTLAQIPENLQIVFGTFTLQFTIYIITLYNPKKRTRSYLKLKHQNQKINIFIPAKNEVEFSTSRVYTKLSEQNKQNQQQQKQIFRPEMQYSSQNFIYYIYTKIVNSNLNNPNQGSSYSNCFSQKQNQSSQILQALMKKFMSNKNVLLVRGFPRQ